MTKGYPKLTFKRILKKHTSNHKDKNLHIAIETNGIKRDDFDRLVEKGSKQKPFDKKKWK